MMGDARGGKFSVGTINVGSSKGPLSFNLSAPGSSNSQQPSSKGNESGYPAPKVGQAYQPPKVGPGYLPPKVDAGYQPPKVGATR